MALPGSLGLARVRPSHPNMHARRDPETWTGSGRSRAPPCPSWTSVGPGIGIGRRLVSARAVESDVHLESQFPSTERPESWSEAQRALVEGAIDLGLGVGGSSRRRRAEVVEEVRAAAEAKGVFYVTNFGVDGALLHQLREAATLFFALPHQEKQTTTVGDGRKLGYSRKFSTASGMAQAGHSPGFRQVFRFSTTAPQDEPRCWPASLPRFRGTCAHYSATMAQLVHFLAGVLAEGLGLPPSYITHRYGALFTNCLLAHSPPQELAPGHVAAPALPPHTDTNMFNVNVSAGVRGVQYYLDGEWLTTPALLDAALVSFGDDLETVSNGRYHAAYHRVLTGPRPRLSLVTTVALSEDAVLAPAAELGPARYRTRRRGDRLDEMVNAYRSLLKMDRTKAGLLLDPDSHLDKTRNIYDLGGVDYINGAPLVPDWGQVLT